MQEINKAFVYRTLNELSSEGFDVSPYRALLVGAHDIPYEVIIFINKHKPLDKLTTYNKIYNKRRSSNLFRNLMKEDLSIEEKAITLSSLLTQSLIGAKHSAQEDRDELIDSINVDLIVSALVEYIDNHNTALIDDAFGTFQCIFRTLFPRK